MNPIKKINILDLKKNLLELCYKKKLHHLGSYFSCLEIIDKIYSQMNESDIFILSNGHSVAALYVVLEKYFGYSAENLIEKHGDHPKLDEENKIYCSTGSLGLGILVAVGRALANPNINVYCLVSDGETAEGSFWEALRFSYEKKLNNLKIYVNANGYCAYDTIDLDYLEKRIKSFHDEVNFCKTTVEHYSFLKGLEAHYIGVSDQIYFEIKQNEKNIL